jgi:putative transposase
LRALPDAHPYPSAAHRHELLALLRRAAADESLQLHAYAMLPAELRVLATPDSEAALSRCMQALGRRYVSHFNRLAGRAGTIWAGRFRSTAVQPGAWTLTALRYVDGAAAAEPELTSAGARTGLAPDPALVDPAEYWALGNTPFERERRYAELLAEPLGEAVSAQIGRCLVGGWPCGDEGYLSAAEQRTARPTRPRPRGRPLRRQGGAGELS